jgi:hypothetical protein
MGKRDILPRLLSLDNDQFHAPDASPPGKEPSVPTEQEDVWALDLFRAFSINEKSLALMGI